MPTYAKIYLFVFSFFYISLNSVMFFSRYQWQVGAWSQCILDRPGREDEQGRPGGQVKKDGPGRMDVQTKREEEEEEACGVGVRHRNLTCLDTKAGTPAPFHLCLQGPVVFANQLIER
jgi:hypothetical protein